MDFLSGPPLLGIDDADRAVGAGDSGVVHQHGDGAEFFGRGVYDAGDVVSLGHVACDGERSAAGGFDFAGDLIELGFIARGQSDGNAFGGESQSDAFADASACAGDERNVPC